MITITCKLLWISDITTSAEILTNYKYDYYGSYINCLKYLQTNENKQATPILIIQDHIYLQTLIRNVTNEQQKVTSHPFTLNYEDLTLQKSKTTLDQLYNTLEAHIITFKQVNNNRDFYKELLKTYNKVTFFEHFNTFKYILTKELRLELEQAIYQYFSSLIDVDSFRNTFNIIENKLKPSQLEKFQPVKNFIFSDRCQILLTLILEKDQTILKSTLDSHSLDYFDVNYLKAYLRDFGKTKEEKAKPKDRVQEIKLLNH